MARCNCSDSKCSCIIVDSPTVTWTGAGRPDNPYRAESGGGAGGGAGWAPGDLKWTARATVDVGWLVADGSPVARADYPALFLAIGPTFGAGDGATTFNLPDYTGRFVLGADPTHPPATSGGQAAVTLTDANMAPHVHPIDHDHPASNTSEAGQHDHDLNRSNSPGGDGRNIPLGQAATSQVGGGPIAGDGSHVHSVDLPKYVGASGRNSAATPVNVLNPYATAIPLIKT